MTTWSEPRFRCDSKPYWPYTLRDYDGTGRLWLVHGPTLPEFGAEFSEQSKAVEWACALRDAYDAGGRSQALTDALRAGAEREGR